MAALPVYGLLPFRSAVPAEAVQFFRIEVDLPGQVVPGEAPAGVPGLDQQLPVVSRSCDRDLDPAREARHVVCVFTRRDPLDHRPAARAVALLMVQPSPPVVSSHCLEALSAGRACADPYRIGDVPSVVPVIVPKEQVLRKQRPNLLLLLEAEAPSGQCLQGLRSLLFRQCAFRVHSVVLLYRKLRKSSMIPAGFSSDACFGVYVSFSSAASPIRSIVSCIFTFAPGK